MIIEKASTPLRNYSSENIRNAQQLGLNGNYTTEYGNLNVNNTTYSFMYSKHIYGTIPEKMRTLTDWVIDNKSIDERYSSMIVLFEDPQKKFEVTIENIENISVVPKNIKKKIGKYKMKGIHTNIVGFMGYLHNGTFEKIIVKNGTNGLFRHSLLNQIGEQYK